MADRTYHFVANNLADNQGRGWRASFGAWGSIYVKWAFNVDITIYDPPRGSDRGEIYCHFPSGAGAVGTPEGGVQGGGYWNETGVAWGSEIMSDQLWDIGSVDAEQDSMALADTHVANWLAANNKSAFYVGRYCDADVPIILHDWGYESVNTSWSRKLKDEDFDSDGNLKSIVIARLFSRRLVHSYPEGGCYTAQGTWVPNDTTLLEDLMPITSEALGIDWKYYPWARKIDGDWKSLNREYRSVPTSANRNAYLRIMKSGAWDDVLNDLEHPDYPESESHIMIASGNWKRAEPYGSGA